MTDNRYGTFKYGSASGHKYGASSTGTIDALAWGIDVDWNGDGFFDGVNEGNRAVSIRMFRGRNKQLRPSGEGFEPIRTGSITVELDNYDGRYDGWNSSSPLYPNVEPGKEIRVRVRNLYTGVIYPVFRGVINDIQPPRRSRGREYGTN